MGKPSRNEARPWRRGGHSRAHGHYRIAGAVEPLGSWQATRTVFKAKERRVGRGRPQKPFEACQRGSRMRHGMIVPSVSMP